MGQTYTRQSSFADGDTITAALFNNEYNQLVNAFSYSATNEATTGHRHDGSAGEGGNIPQIGDLDFLNKIVVDSTNNRWGFYVQVASSAVEQLRLQDGALLPVTDSDVDLGTSSLYFKDAYIDSITTTGNVAVGGNLTVTGTTTFNGGTITMGDAATDNVVFGADVDSHIIPDDDDTYDLGSSSQEWRNLYIDGTANIDSLVADTADINGGTIDGAIIGGSSAAAITGTTITGTAITGTSFVIGSADISEAELEILDGATVTTDELNILDGVTATTAELNIMDGVTSTTAELNILDGVTATAAEINTLDGITSTVAELNILDGVTASATDINLIDGITNGTVIASKAIVTDANKDITGGRNITISGELDAATLDISGNADIDGTLETDALSINGTTVTSTAAELNILDGVTSTAAELNILDGVTSTAAELNILDGKAFLDEDDMSSNSATGIASQQSIKAYVDSQVTAQDLDFQGDTGGALSIDLDSESLTIAGGTGLDTVGSGNTVTVNIDSTVATLTGSQTLTNKTLTTPIISSISNTGTLTLPTSTDTLVGRATTDTLTNKTLTSATLTSPVINTGVSGTAFLDDDTFGTATATTLASSESIKAYVDTTVAATNEVVEDTTPQLGGDLDLNSSDITGTGNINITGTIQSSGNITGTLATAAQPNITSVGTLTGLDVAGTPTFDGLTVDGTGDFNIGTENVGIDITSTDAGAYIGLNDNNATGFYLGTAAGIFYLLDTGNSPKLKVAASGDISFYDDTGTSQALFWDASAESLGIGTTSPDEPLHIFSSTDADLLLEGTETGTSSRFAKVAFANNISGTTTDLGAITADTDGATNSSAFKFYTANAGSVTNKMTITSDGNLLLNTANSPTTTKAIISADYSAGGTTNTGLTIAGRQSGNWYNNGIHALGSSGLVFSTGTTGINGADASNERMRIDSSGNVGIGNTPNATFKLDVEGAVRTNGSGFYVSENYSSTNNVYKIYENSNEFRIESQIFGNANAASSPIVFATSNTDGRLARMTIDNTGNVGIGTDTPVAILTSKNAGSLTLDSNDGDHTGFGLFLGTDTPTPNTVNTAIGFGNISSGRKYAAIGMQTYADADQNGLNFYVQSTASGSSATLTEAMRIDSERFVLIGKTSSANVYTTAGIDIRPSGTIFSTRDQAASLVLSRTTNDGDIAEFRKDGLPVGSIGTKGGDLTIGTGVVGLRFHDGTGSIRPITTVDGTVTDDTVDLGTTVARFQDLYLSGGAYLGGTGAANKLDDYEEGTWTPVYNTGYSSVSYGAQVGVYTKIGNMVELKFYLNVNSTTASGNLTITGLPFTSKSNSINNNVGIIHVQSNSGTLTTDSPICRMPVNSTTIFVQTQGTGGVNSMAGSELGNGIINGSITYFTA